MIIDTALIHTNLNVSTLTGRFQYTHDMLFYHCYEISIYKKIEALHPLLNLLYQFSILYAEVLIHDDLILQMQ